MCPWLLFGSIWSWQSLKLTPVLNSTLQRHMKAWSQSSVRAVLCARTCGVLSVWNLMCPSYGLLRISFFWDVTLYCWVNASWHLEGIFTLWNFTNCMPNKTLSHPRRLCVHSNTAARTCNLTPYAAFTNYLTEPLINQCVLSVYFLVYSKTVDSIVCYLCMQG